MVTRLSEPTGHSHTCTAVDRGKRRRQAPLRAGGVEPQGSTPTAPTARAAPPDRYGERRLLLDGSVGGVSVRPRLDRAHPLVLGLTSTVRRL